MDNKEHTDPQYEAELAELNELVLALGGRIERQLGRATRALEERSDVLAEKTISSDKKTDRMDKEIHALCLRLLALHQPAARDLRLITTTQSVTADLERIGDIIVNFCERVLELNQEVPVDTVDLPRMVAEAESMLHRSIDAYARRDVDLALSVCRADDLVDRANRELFHRLEASMLADPTCISRSLRTIFLSKYIERIADHATNIASMVVFMVTAKSIRHLDRVPREV